MARGYFTRRGGVCQVRVSVPTGRIFHPYFLPLTRARPRDIMTRGTQAQLHSRSRETQVETSFHRVAIGSADLPN